jgi:hypothetical protein
MCCGGWSSGWFAVVSGTAGYDVGGRQPAFQADGRLAAVKG